MGVWGLGFGIWGFGFGIWCFWFGIWDFGFGLRATTNTSEDEKPENNEDLNYHYCRYY